MAVTKPEINELLDKTEQNPFLLCSLASKRACDINNMLRGQHLRVTQVQDVDDITTVVSGKEPVTIAMKEIADGILSFESENFKHEVSEPEPEEDQD
ncbi:MAG: DNA-directed RNA polymerase subunit omega [Atopobiaceae bacterium]|nr:DNA-directed RNA polymerase subunit omega [Atopobiaceae bacterium]